LPQPDGVPLPVGIRYPTDAPATIHAIALLQQQVAENAPVLAGRHALVVMSHGNGGWFGGHLDTALALAAAGFVVAAPTHAGDNDRDQSHATDLPARPRQIRDTIDAVPTDWSGRDLVDPDPIGLFGFSSGGLTVLVVAGGVPDLARVAPFCAAHASNSACALLRSHPAPLPAADVWTHDPRIRAVVAAAPALGFSFGSTGLAGVHAPVQLWQTRQDRIEPAPDFAEPVPAGLERAGTQVGYRDVPGRGPLGLPCPLQRRPGHGGAGDPRRARRVRPRGVPRRLRRGGGGLLQADPGGAFRNVWNASP
jgi:predicted dienelactone hydrolase